MARRYKTGPPKKYPHQIFTRIDGDTKAYLDSLLDLAQEATGSNKTDRSKVLRFIISEYRRGRGESASRRKVGG